jgi:hypothetical protein
MATFTLGLVVRYIYGDPPKRSFTKSISRLGPIPSVEFGPKIFPNSIFASRLDVRIARQRVGLSEDIPAASRALSGVLGNRRRAAPAQPITEAFRTLYRQPPRLRLVPAYAAAAIPQQQQRVTAGLRLCTASEECRCCIAGRSPARGPRAAGCERLLQGDEGFSS